jgi:hypothetical protein
LEPPQVNQAARNIQLWHDVTVDHSVMLAKFTGVLNITY